MIPKLTSDELEALANGARFLYGRTRAFIHDELSYRVAVTSSGAEARVLETRIRGGGFPRSGRPQINP